MKLFYKSVIYTLILFVYSESNNAQTKFGFELNYGLNNVYEPRITNFNHLKAGVVLNLHDDWELKLDFASEKFRSPNEILDTETGIDIFRATIHLSHNLSSLYDREYYYNRFNIYSHTGIGYTIAKSSYLNTGKDEIVNVVIGVNPRYRIVDGFYITADASFIINPSQHYNWDGSLSYTGKPNPITGLYYTISGGILIKFNDE